MINIDIQYIYGKFVLANKLCINSIYILFNIFHTRLYI